VQRGNRLLWQPCWHGWQPWDGLCMMLWVELLLAWLLQ